MFYIIPIVSSYLLGSLIFSLIVGKLLKGVDVRSHGSGNAGATNTLRVLGIGPAILVLALDIGKGVLAVWLGKWFAPDLLWVHVVCGISVIIGHNWPVFFRFRGGKGIATTIGMVATLSFLPGLMAGIIAILSIIITRYVSLGSLLFTGLLPIFLVIMHYPVELIFASILLFIFAVWRHRKNIEKLLHGQENRLGAKKREETQ
ncbi:glycerol-3-phosphate 1-O-acyltransferase PlsY [Ferviditalea candida]|uniref:Glycerol-3-phosphate acyltransferase n=1 Tax=Ferviditalea candida TaxID=3108399 RepID=A0ABU5ZJW6_9BACL|nr:glycerol-3-phosphate 1-O-acyltransferase PlsY [Paenibacillaceae bacterium T2]